MFKCFLILLLAISVAQYPGKSLAKDNVNIKSIEKAGFENVGAILEQMSPQQLREIIKQAESMLPDLQDMSQQEIDQLTNELLKTDSKLDSKAVNVNKLDTKKSKTLKERRKDIKNYMNQH